MREGFSIILKISSGAVGVELEEEDESVIGYTHRGGGIIVVLRTRVF